MHTLTSYPRRAAITAKSREVQDDAKVVAAYSNAGSSKALKASLVTWLDGLSAVQLASVFCGCLIVFTLLGIFLIHPLMRRLIHAKSPVNDLVIFTAGSFGLIYAVLMGLLTVATFQTTKDVEDNIGREASSLSTIYHSADGLPEPVRSELKAQLRDYTHYVIEKDWPAHRKGLVPLGGEPTAVTQVRNDL